MQSMDNQIVYEAKVEKATLWGDKNICSERIVYNVHACTMYLYILVLELLAKAVSTPPSIPEISSSGIVDNI